MGIAETIAAFLGAKGSSLHLNFLNFTSKGSRKTLIKGPKKIVNNSEVKANQVVNNTYNITINGPIDSETKRQLSPLLQGYENKDVLFLADEPKKLVLDVKQFENSDSMARGLIQFFKIKLSPKDLRLMRTGLYIQHLRSINQLKAAKTLWGQVTSSSSPRDRNIVNLSSAGYFHTYFRPLYKQLMRASEQDASRRFNKEYERILDDTTFAIFVNNSMSVDDIIEKTIKRAAKNIKYAVKIETITVHAIGPRLIPRVREAAKILKLKFPELRVSATPRDLEIITVTINYRNNGLTKSELSLEGED